MTISYSRRFKKQYNKLQSHIQAKFYERLTVFIKNRQDERLQTRKLHGRLKGLYSINITGDIRAVFDEITSDKVEFVAIGSHNKLYS
jgi:addiction module RelE/StbE family toxin